MATESGFKGFNRRKGARRSGDTPEQMGITEDAHSNIHGLRWMLIGGGLVFVGWLVGRFVLGIF